MLPSEAQDLLLGNSQNVKQTVPFDPIRFSGCRGDPLEVNIANMFLNENKKSGSGDKTNGYSKNITVNVSNDSANISANGGGNSCSSANDLNFSNALNQIFNPSPKSQNLVPNMSNHLLPERQNSFSSEISSSEFDVPSYYQPNYPNVTTTQYITNSPLKNSFDNYCYSPQPQMSSPIPSQVDYGSPVVIQQQTNYMSMPNGYMVGSDCSSNAFNYSYVEQQPPMNNYVGNDNNLLSKNENNQQLVNKVHFAVGDSLTRQRCNSVGSSLILGPKSRASLGISYSRSLTDGETSLNLSECSLSSNEDIHAYVTEVTKELATEIKSEIREVISKVEDVLSEENNGNGNGNLTEHRGSKAFVADKLERTNSLPSVSANDIAQYLMGVSKEMAEEMKSEIRELVSSVVSPESSPMPDKKANKKVTIDTNGISDKSKITRFGNENISQSRDSGINLSYSETVNKEKEGADEKSENSEKSTMSDESKRDRSESLDSFQESERIARNRSESLDSLRESDPASKSQTPKRKISRASKKAEKCLGMNQCSEESSNDEGMGDVQKPRWHCPSKAVWKPTVEVMEKKEIVSWKRKFKSFYFFQAINEFEMIKNGDKILVCLSGGKDSLTLLHTLHQYKFYASSRGIRFELGAVTVDPGNSAYNPKPLMTYVESLGVPYFYEEQSK